MRPPALREHRITPAGGDLFNLSIGADHHYTVEYGPVNADRFRFGYRFKSTPVPVASTALRWTLENFAKCLNTRATYERGSRPNGPSQPLSPIATVSCSHRSVRSAPEAKRSEWDSPSCVMRVSTCGRPG